MAGGTPDESKLLYVKDSKEWRAWLHKHYRSEREIWLVYYKKLTGKQRIPYNDAVEEALCFGWIDSTVRRLNEDRYAQRFSVRNPRSTYSQANKERLRGLINEGKVMPEVLFILDKLGDGSKFEVPPDILKAVKGSAAAWENFQKLSPPYIRIRVAFIDAARDRPEEFKKRLRHFIEMTAKNRRFGFGGIEKYY